MAYIDQLTQAFNFRTNPAEALSRTLGATLLVSLALNGVEDSGVNTNIPPVYKAGPIPAHIENEVIKGTSHYVPANASQISETGPSASLVFPQTYAPEFHAAPFGSQQKHRLDGFVEELRGVFRDHPDAKVVVRISGSASDESEVDSTRGDQNLGRPSSHDKHLAEQRAALVATYMQGQLPLKDHVRYTNSGHEVVLPRLIISEVDKVAHDVHLNRDQLLKAYNSGNKLALNQAARTVLRQAFDLNRGAAVSSTITYKTKPFVGPCDEVVRSITDPDKVLAKEIPGKDGWDIHVLPFIIPPMPRWRRKNRNKFPKSTPEEPSVPQPDETGSATRDQTLPPKTRPIITKADTATSPNENYEPYTSRSGVRVRASMARRIRYDSLQSDLRVNKRMLKAAESYPGRKSEYLEAEQKLHMGNIRGIKQEMRGLRLRKFMARGLIAGTLLPLLPFPWLSSHERKTTINNQACSTTEYRYGKSSRYYGNLLGIAVVRALQGRNDWNKQLDIGPYQAPDDVTYTRKPFTRILVDDHGRIIDRKTVQATTTTFLR